MDISKKLKDVRESKGLTLEELSEKCEREVDLIKGWEDGSIVPSASDLIGLSKVYEMTMDEMIYNDAEAPEYNAESGTYKSISSESEKSVKTLNKGRGFSKGEKITLIIFPVLCLAVFLVLGFAMGLWHPGWIVFIIIPIYYILIFVLRNIGNDAEEAVEEFLDENK
ncbi:MAG: helix-turn-helix transcriptional regulator [Lachnospiraceae bacterium]|nr:helix-turn-helix transcriptional regulator [Lachnospiraceae bacterium]